MKKILITGIGGDIAQSVAKIIRKHYPLLSIIGTDTHNQHGGSLYADRCFCLPLAKDKSYLTKLTELIDAESIDVVIPMTEPELSVIQHLIEDKDDIYWVTAGKQTLDAGLDKLATVNRIKDMGLNVPWTTTVENNEPLEYPCILKSRYGSGSRAVFTVNNKQEAKHLAKSHPDAIYQELLTPADREVTCAVYRTKDGRVSTLQMLRKLVGGFTGWATVIDDQAVNSMCNAIANGLNLTGSMNVQLRITDAGPRVFEINPRFSSTVLMRHLLGFSDVLWTMSEIEGMEIQFPTITKGQIVVRTQEAAVLGNQI